MKHFLQLLLLFISINAGAALPSGAPSISPDAVGTTGGSSSIPPSDLSGTGINGKFYISAGDGWNGVTAASFYPFVKAGVNYIVTTGKTAYCFNGTVTSGTASVAYQYVASPTAFSFGATVIGANSAFQCGNSGKYCNLSGPSAGQSSHVPGTYQFNSTTWPGIQPSSSTTYGVFLECYEL